jgi:CRP/FNR family transcriptional regulator, anaerobic regulatory protein
MTKENITILDFIDQLLQRDKNDLITIKKFKSGNAILRQDELIRSVYFVKTGLVKCFITQDNGKNYILDFFNAGHLVGEFGFVSSQKSFCTVVALTEVEVYKLKLPYMEELMKSYPSFTSSLVKSLASRLFQTSERAAYQQTYPAEYALLRFLLLSESSLSIAKQDIADYLGITKRNLNRKLKLFIELNILSLTGKKMILSKADPKLLFQKLENLKT